MKRSISLVVVLMVLAVTMPSLVNCRVLASQEKAIHEPVKEKTSTEDNISTRVLISSKVNTMSSGPSRRGSGH
ncbi:hypothetical protein AAZX31_11G050700 [Glycine max]|uniref:Uncharacterized protein n=2 Tax=Glycine subgen. Soja TaxID=1462606 RepID=K7LN59_SOYBN|nr:hypothetical protein JHK85_030754 [Glycine max]KHN12963.1 hypothetical protein glysoja_027251 [Glycine soja]KAG4993389.1 hypothetical protein JHK86_030216 [Glycine max]KAG5123391.1 hypothetical protein JHK82_030128 [Glycine max]KAH1157695.1 hypothetical protein GYH30_030094 [Glycine max]